jgi:hypothetical protein
MDARFVAANAIPTSRLPSPILVLLADDSPSPAAWITEVTHPLTLTIADHQVEEFVELCIVAMRLAEVQSNKKTLGLLFY